MEAVCKGAKEKSGMTVGVVSGNKRNTSNTYVDVEVLSGFTNFGEEGLIISMADAPIVLEEVLELFKKYLWHTEARRKSLVLEVWVDGVID